MGGQTVQQLRLPAFQTPADFASFVLDPARQPQELQTLQQIAEDEGLPYLASALADLLNGRTQIERHQLQRALEQLVEQGLPRLQGAVARFAPSAQVTAAVSHALAQSPSGEMHLVVGDPAVIVDRGMETPPPAVASAGSVVTYEHDVWELMEEAGRIGAILSREDLGVIVGEVADRALRAALEILKDSKQSRQSKMNALKVLRDHIPEILDLDGSDEQRAVQAHAIFSDYFGKPLWQRALAVDYSLSFFDSTARRDLNLVNVAEGLGPLRDYILEHPEREDKTLYAMAVVTYYRVVLHQLNAAGIDQLEETIAWARQKAAEFRREVGEGEERVRWLEGEIHIKEEFLLDRSALARKKAALRGVEGNLRSLGELTLFLDTLETIAQILEDASTDFELKKMAYVLLQKINRPPLEVTLTDFGLRKFFEAALGRGTPRVWMIDGKSAPREELAANIDRIRNLAPRVLALLRQGPPASGRGEAGWLGRLRRLAH